MIAVDTNILAYAHVPNEPQHPLAFDALRRLAASGEAWGIPAPCLAEFIRVLTHPRIHGQALEPVLEAVRVMLALPGATLLLPDADFATRLDGLCRALGGAGNKVFDAQIAAICLANRVEVLLSEDRGLPRVHGLRVVTLADSLAV